MRPTVCNGCERKFLCVYRVVSPIQGQLDWMIVGEMNTIRMTEFLAQVTTAHRRVFIVMVVDAASSHVGKDLVLPKNVRLLSLPSQGPELNPEVHVWEELRLNGFPNRVYADMAGERAQREAGLPTRAGDPREPQESDPLAMDRRLIVNAQ
jgi:hypothetical protein